MKTRQKSIRAGYLAITLAFAGSSSSAFAAQQTWDGAASDIWNSSDLNWAGAAFTSSNDALFTGTPTKNVTTATGLTIGAITLDNTFTGTVAMTGANTVGGPTTLSGGTLSLTNSSGLGSSAITVNGTANMLWLNAGNVTYSNAISGAGTTKVTTGNGDVILTGNLSGFTGTLDLNQSVGSASKTRFTTTQGNLISNSATINVNSGTTLYLNQALNYGASVVLFGAGNTENLGALRVEAGANQTGSVTLRADSFIGANSSASTISGNIGESGGSFGFTKVGNSTLTLSGSNNYTGITTISGGTISVGSGGTTGSLGSGNVTNNATLTFNRSNDLTVSGNIANNTGGAGTVNKQGAGKLTLSGTNTVGNNASVTAGTLEITGTTSTDGGSSSNVGYFSVSGTSSVTVQSGAFLNILGTTNATKPNSIVGQNAAGTSTLTVNGGALTIGGNTGFALGNNIGTAIGVLTVSSGTATITAGSATLQNMQNFVALGRDGATGIINLDGGILATGRQFVRDGSSGDTAGTGTATFNFNGGTLQAQADQTSGNGWFETTTSGNFQVVTTTVKVGGAKIDTGTFTTNINTVLAHDSALGGTADGGLTKSGSGTLNLGGANTYTGATAVRAGMLALGLNGTISDTLVLGTASPTVGTLDVTAKGAFSETNVSGNGTINIGTGKTVTVTGSLSPGFSPGTLNVTGNLALAASTSTTMELAGNGGVAGTNSDYVNVSGSMTLGGLLAITSHGGYDVSQNAIYNLFDSASVTGNFNGVSVGGNALSLATDVWSGTFSGTTYSFTQSTGVLTVVPEPTAALLGGLSMLVLLRRRRM